MASQIERVTVELRRRILRGELKKGDRILELRFAPELGVSRTPLRLALGELEKQGLVERVGKRGFCVRGVTLDQVAQAIDVRGVLEGLAVRILSESGISNDTLAALTQCVAEGAAILDQAVTADSTVDSSRWADMNARFHRILVEAAGNAALLSALEHVARAPLASAGVLGITGRQLDLELSYLRRAQNDHEDILAAIATRESSRAEAMMREHARRSRDNKRKLAEQASMPTEPEPAVAHSRDQGSTSASVVTRRY